MELFDRLVPRRGFLESVVELGEALEVKGQYELAETLGPEAKFSSPDAVALDLSLCLEVFKVLLDRLHELEVFGTGRQIHPDFVAIHALRLPLAIIGKMKVSELLASASEPVFSFEFFPPRDANGEAALNRALGQLKPLSPGFVSVTYGAGGSTKSQTLQWAGRIKEEVGCEAVIHQTCLGVSRLDIDETLGAMSGAGLKNILALRGDPPHGGEVQESAFHHAVDLVAYIRSVLPDVCILAACHPEGHMEASSRTSDLDNLKRKVDAGVDVLVSQIFFDNRVFFDFLGRARSKGITVPIIPGIMPIQSTAQIKRFVELCGASLPPQLLHLLEEYRETPKAVFYIGVAHAVAQASELLANGVPAVHFYTLNKSPATRLVVQALRS